MTKSRLEAFSDGVIAIIITIMVLELKAPHDASWHSIKAVLPSFLSYVISFTLVAIYWGNHHHLFHTVSHVNSKIIWANIHLLFWLSLIPFATSWVGENFSSLPVAVYAGLQAICGIAYYILLRSIISSPSHSLSVHESLEKQSRKGTISLLIYILAIPAAFLHPAISTVMIVLVALIWLIPDRNIEKALKD
ncbi:MAG TPA: TMEM175 family protein [Chitinophagaceae bacterium]|nr:TMEM175 family protein [Chitinophagaceae bacterium]